MTAPQRPASNSDARKRAEAHTADNDAIRWVVFCAMHPGEERLFDNRSTSELRAMNSKAAGIADALVLAGMRVTSPGECLDCGHAARLHYALGHVGCHNLRCTCTSVLPPGSSAS